MSEQNRREFFRHAALLSGAAGLAAGALPASIQKAFAIDPAPGSTDLPAEGDPALTQRERDVLRLVVTGVGNREIAASLGISPNTVQYHVANLLRKHGARTRAELAAFSVRA